MLDSLATLSLHDDAPLRQRSLLWELAGLLVTLLRPAEVRTAQARDPGGSNLTVSCCPRHARDQYDPKIQSMD